MLEVPEGMDRDFPFFLSSDQADLENASRGSFSQPVDNATTSSQSGDESTATITDLKKSDVQKTFQVFNDLSLRKQY